MGMTTIGLVQRKDDVGTTTIATNLAVTLRNRGDSVLLVDAGPQGRQKGTVRDWSATGDSQTPETISVDRPVVHEKLPSTEGFDVAIIDATGKLEEMTISAIKASDLTLVPVQPSTADPKKVGQVIDCIETHQAPTEDPPNERRPAARFVISRATGSSKMGEQIQQIVSEAPFGRLDAGTSQRVAYARALGEGASVHETGDKEAQAEVKAITDEIEQILRADGQ
ncbi:chromosome partitioning protein [Salinibacter ruber]|nr:chromosome partitioning protein [Salinibacter ruber]